MFKKFNFKPGKIIYDDFDINPNIPWDYFKRRRSCFHKKSLC